MLGDGPNLYAFVRNRPTSLFDPLGLLTECEKKVLADCDDCIFGCRVAVGVIAAQGILCSATGAGLPIGIFLGAMGFIVVVVCQQQCTTTREKGFKDCEQQTAGNT